ncbi:hypothetical protein PYW08_002756 [Mythimna loreyi]|uniref:Uncharacterized protein n=1 Tax=Mythimna loreyi TaxID=667449 RepID=A0ACC2QNX3_9NEOP|nr:hypothetical protein PYW08_002756 [Mythimna loreyi]
MKITLLWFLGVTVYTALAGPVKSSMDNYIYPWFIKFPDGEGIMHNVDLESPIQLPILEEVNRHPANNEYLLYTRRNPTSSQSLEINNAASIENSYFNPDLPTVVIAHGWLSDQESDINPVIRDAYLGKHDVNVIVLDWRRLASANYMTAVQGVPAVGRGLGQFLAFLNSITGAPFDQMHLIGFSLGAHLVGNAGRELRGRVARVTALDPAGPLWDVNPDRVNFSDGIYVEAIHTDGGYTVGGLGIGSDVGSADFYVNGGVSQPGCLTNSCNHNKSWRYFAATVSYDHIIGNQCFSQWQITCD